MSTRLFVAMLALGAPSASLADPQAPKAPDVVSGYQDQRICETISVVGSRLGKKRFCGTRAEWQEKRLRDRQEVERAQAMPCVLTHNGGNGKPGC